MKKALFLLPIFIASLISCSENSIKIPDDVLKQQQMTEILTDIHIAQAAINIKSQTDTITYNMNDYVAYILKKRNVKTNQFLNSLKFYSLHPEALNQVYDSVITGLSRMEGEVVK